MIAFLKQHRSSSRERVYMHKQIFDNKFQQNFLGVKSQKIDATSLLLKSQDLRSVHVFFVFGAKRNTQEYFTQAISAIILWVGETGVLGIKVFQMTDTFHHAERINNLVLFSISTDQLHPYMNLYQVEILWI